MPFLTSLADAYSFRSSLLPCRTSGTVQKTEAKLVSQLGWLARRAERYGHDKFQRNLERVRSSSHELGLRMWLTYSIALQSRAGMHLIVDLLNQSRVHALALKNMHDVGLGYRLPPLAVQGTALDSFRPRFYTSSTSDSLTPTNPDASVTLDTASSHQQAACSDDRGLRRWVPRPVSAWLWRSSSSTPPPSSPSA